MINSIPLNRFISKINALALLVCMGVASQNIYATDTETTGLVVNVKAVAGLIFNPLSPGNPTTITLPDITKVNYAAAEYSDQDSSLWDLYYPSTASNAGYSVKVQYTGVQCNTPVVAADAGSYAGLTNATSTTCIPYQIYFEPCTWNHSKISIVNINNFTAYPFGGTDTATFTNAIDNNDRSVGSCDVQGGWAAQFAIKRPGLVTLPSPLGPGLNYTGSATITITAVDP